MRSLGGSDSGFYSALTQAFRQHGSPGLVRTEQREMDEENAGGGEETASETGGRPWRCNQRTTGQRGVRNLKRISNSDTDILNSHGSPS